jgi:hypothetical protein
MIFRQLRHADNLEKPIMSLSMIRKWIVNLNALISTICIMVPAQADLTNDQLKSLQDAIKEMCLFPDRAGNYLSVGGEVKVGLPVAVKIVKGDLSGKISYDSWKGIPITLDKYKTDPRQCAVEMTKLLLPSFQTQVMKTSGDGSPIITGTGPAAKVDIRVEKAASAIR